VTEQPNNRSALNARTGLCFHRASLAGASESDR
jgi:hypothetical protein